MIEEESSRGIQCKESGRDDMYMMSLAEEFGTGSLAEMMDEESNRGIRYRESGRDDG
jgi:hypothetical protein